MDRTQGTASLFSVMLGGAAQLGLQDGKAFHSFGAFAEVAGMPGSRLNLSVPWTVICQVLLYTRIVMAASSQEAKAGAARPLSLWAIPKPAGLVLCAVVC